MSRPQHDHPRPFCGMGCPAYGDAFATYVIQEPLPDDIQFGFVNPETGDFIAVQTDAFVERLERGGWVIERPEES